MRKKSIKILSLLLTLALLVGVLPGMTAYAADTYTLTVTDGSKTIVTVSNYPIGYELYISGEALGGDFDSFWGDPTPSGIVSDVERTPDSKFIIFCVYHTGNGTLSGSYGTPGGGPGMPYLLTVTCVKNAPASYTVTYDPDRGSGTMEPTTVSKNDEGKYIYKVESCGFTAPEGETFDYWLGSDEKTYRPGPEVEISGNLTLKAQWKEEKKPDGGEKKTSGGGSGSFVDLVFNIPGADNSWEYIGGGVPQRAYRLSFAPMQGGSAAFLLNSGESGDTMNVYPQTTVRVVPTPAPGYRLASIVWSMIDGSASYDITETQTFVMPAMDAVVYVTFQPIA